MGIKISQIRVIGLILKTKYPGIKIHCLLKSVCPHSNIRAHFYFLWVLAFRINNIDLPYSNSYSVSFGFPAQTLGRLFGLDSNQSVHSISLLEYWCA